MPLFPANKLYREDKIVWLNLADGFLRGYDGSSGEEILFDKVVDTHEAQFNSQAGVSTRIEECLAKWRLQKAPFWLIAPGCHTLIRSIYFPGKKKHSLQLALAWEWLEYFPLPKEEFIYDMLDYPAEGGGGINAWIFACQINYLLPYLQICEDAGILPAGIDISSLCCHAAARQTPCLVLEAEPENCTVTGFARQEIFYHNSFKFDKGDDSFLQELPWQYQDAPVPVHIFGSGAAQIKRSLAVLGLSDSSQRVIATLDQPMMTMDQGFLIRRTINQQPMRKAALQ